MEFFKEHKLTILLFVGFVIAAIVLGTVVNGDASLITETLND